MNAHLETDVLILGGGLVGTSPALDLAYRGVDHLPAQLDALVGQGLW